MQKKKKVNVKEAFVLSIWPLTSTRSAKRPPKQLLRKIEGKEGKYVAR